MSLSNEMQSEVGVDQRALVNILARHPGQFDVLRELVQNADDAGSAIVKLRFETGSRPAGRVGDIIRPVTKWIIRNKGTFRPEDWDRLGKIAAGNKDPTKVGAFGVGFYSVLSKSDRPLVKSGGKSLQFYRTEDGRLCNVFGPERDDDGWTSIELELNREETLPKLDDLAGFLVSSVALLANIRTISVRLDGERLFQVEKKSSDPPNTISIPKHLIPTSQKKALRVDSVQRTVQTITIDAAEWALTRPPPASLSSHDDDGECLCAPVTRDEQDDQLPTPTTPAVRQENELTHDLYTATISVVLDKDSEVRKGVGSILKPLPDTFKCKGVYFNYEQHQSFVSSINKSPFSMAHLFKSFVPENNNGRLFIGQGTNQTTGVGLHFASHFLSTMERGAIDLANGHIAAWNKEVLWVSGFLARVIYEEDMRLPNPTSERAKKLGLKTMARFAFGKTSPHSGVSEILQDAFFTCESWPKSPFPVVSDTGICCASGRQFRQSNELTFLKMYRTLHPDIQQSQQSEITKRLKIPRLQYQDIVDEFKTGVSQETMEPFFTWWQRHIRSTNIPREFCRQFASMGVLRSRMGANIPFKDIRYFTTFPIDDDISHPESIYIDTSSGAPTKDAIALFGWTPLLLLDWLKNASSKASEVARKGDLDAGRLISCVIIQFSLIPESILAPWYEVAELVEDIRCIPTNKGLRVPRESYLEEADICQQLPVANVADFLNIQGVYVADHGYRFLNHDHVEGVLKKLGVHDDMEWPDLVERMETSASETTNERLLRHLFRSYSDRKTLSPQTINDLKTKGMLCSRDHGLKPTTQLYLPDADDNIHKLGLPVLALPSSGVIYQDLTSFELAKSSSVKRFLEYLGIQSYPSLQTLIEDCAASSVQEIHETALDYFLKHFDKQYDDYNAEDFAHVAFVPTKYGSRARLREVFTSSDWEKLKFEQVSDRLRHRDIVKLGIKPCPPIDTVIERFKTPKQWLQNWDIAKLWFENLALHAKYSPAVLREFSTIPFVPVKIPVSSSEITTTEYSYHPPKDCFIVSSDSKPKHHRDIFPFVDFGLEGNNFLEACSAKKFPDATDIAREMARDPQKYLNALGHDTKLYTDDLLTIALQFDSVPPDIKATMREAKMFLGSRQNADAGELLLASEVVIGDWESRSFGDHVSLAPNYEVIQKMYHKTGSSFMKEYVQYELDYFDPQDGCPPALSREQIIRGVKYFMSQQDKNKATKNLYDGKEVKDDFMVKVCKSLTVTKKFAPCGVLDDKVDPIITPEIAGFDLETFTLWLEDSGQSTHQCYDAAAVALCGILLRTFSMDDVMLLASLIAMDEAEFRRMYPEKTADKLEAKISRKAEVHPYLPWFAAPLFGASLGPEVYDQHIMAPEDDVQTAVAQCSRPAQDGRCPDFSKPPGNNRTTFKKSNSHCKEAREIQLVERKELQGKLRFFLSHDARYLEPPEAALEEFSALIIELADTNDDLMAFNRDQKFLFFNLYHYHEFYFNSKLPDTEKFTATDWFLIMAHQIAHNRSQDHDEYHGSLTSRLVLKFLPDLQEKYSCVAEGLCS